MFGDNARATNNLARETREASKRETQATYKNTEAIKELAKIAENMPVEIGDNLPKYSEREVRELRNEIDRLKELAQAVYAFQDGLYVVIEPSNFGMDLDLKLIMGNDIVSSEVVQIEDVNFSEGHISAKLKYNPNINRHQPRQAQKVNIRRW